ncbi:hypothetical protein AX15_004363 [Amanita polypyramis BW_CC]|nr:hypothetical protein AX15_004363 [Amanita polypyramis BW_CC]
MPRIRKKPSKRQTTNKRRKLHDKIREGKKKKAKEAKKNPQWKSKHKKDPGIPNSFPYKEQILAEVAEQRRLEAEERERRKKEKKARKAAQNQKEAKGDVLGRDGIDVEGEEDDSGQEPTECATKSGRTDSSVDVASLSVKVL